MCPIRRRRNLTALGRSRTSSNLFHWDAILKEVPWKDNIRGGMDFLIVCLLNPKAKRSGNQNSHGVKQIWKMKKGLKAVKVSSALSIPIAVDCKCQESNAVACLPGKLSIDTCAAHNYFFSKAEAAAKAAEVVQKALQCGGPKESHRSIANKHPWFAGNAGAFRSHPLAQEEIECRLQEEGIKCRLQEVKHSFSCSWGYS
eukprot:1161827-Pelagomonas_calceolata.AAC.9